MKETITQILAAVGALGIIAILWTLITSVTDCFKRRELNRQMLTDSRNDHEHRIIDLEISVRALKQSEQTRCEEEDKARNTIK